MGDENKKVDLIVKCKAAVTVNSEREIIKNAGIAINGEEIVSVDKWESISNQYSGERVIGSKKMVAMPGLIDSHVHTSQGLLRGCADDLGWFPYLRDYIWPLQSEYKDKDAQASLKLVISELIKSGTTLYMDPLVHSRYGFDEMANTINDIGIRAVMAKLVMDMENEAENDDTIKEGMLESGDKSLNEAVESIKKWNGKDSLVKVFFGPRVPRPKAPGCSPEFYKKVSKLAQKYGTGVTVHLAGERDDPPYFRKNYNKTPVEFLHSLGLTGKNVALVMCCWIMEGDIQLLKDTGTSVVHCPSANMKMASGVAPVSRMVKNEVNVALGTDSAANNNCHDLIREMKAASLLQNIHTMDPEGLIAETAIEMATINSARAVGLEEKIGSLEVGKKADIILIDVDKPHYNPFYDVISNIVYTGTGSDVDTVIINGDLIMKDRNILSLNVKEIVKEANYRGEKILSKADIEVDSEWPIL